MSPNWCENDLVVRGGKKELARFKKLAKGRNRVIDFEKFIPGGGKNEWNQDIWGTKWNAHTPEIIEESDDEIQYAFLTAWSPPEPVILKMGKMFPKLDFDFRYFECGCAFNGCIQIEKGKVTLNASGEYFGDRGG